MKAGRKVFNTSCGTCHAGGITKTNHNVGLDPETLALATPARDNIAALVDYMQDPTSYDGEYSIADLHLLRSRDLYPAMRDLTDEDLELMSTSLWLPRFLVPSGAAARSTSDPQLCRPIDQRDPTEACLQGQAFLVGSISTDRATGRDCWPPWSWGGGCTTTPASLD